MGAMLQLMEEKKEKNPKEPSVVKGRLIVRNDRGLHTRPCTELVKCASRYKSEIFLHFQGSSVNAKSLLGILTLAATKGSRITVEATGVDARSAVEGILELAQHNFNMNY